jgi:hypothetical protein
MFFNTRNKNMYGFGFGMSTGFEILGHLHVLPVSGEGVGPPSMVITYIPSYVPRHKNQGLYGLGIGISTVFEILGHLLFKGAQDHPVWS